MVASSWICFSTTALTFDFTTTCTFMWGTLRFFYFPFHFGIKFRYRFEIFYTQFKSILYIFLVFNIASKELMILDLNLWYHSLNCIVSSLPLQVIVKPALSLLRSSINITELLMISFCCWISRATRPIDASASLLYFSDHHIVVMLFSSITRWDS